VLHFRVLYGQQVSYREGGVVAIERGLLEITAELLTEVTRLWQAVHAAPEVEFDCPDAAPVLEQLVAIVRGQREAFEEARRGEPPPARG
jgi:hypothetical protein